MPCAALGPAGAMQAARIQIRADFSEADAVLAILAKRSASLAIPDSDWQTLIRTEPYERLKKREASMHRDFSDADFARFILSDALLQTRGALVRAVSEWKQVDLQAAAGRVLAYLPPEATIRTKVYPVIKPLHNSFVFETATDPAIFLSLDPALSPEAFLNTVAHEMHHIGLSSTDHAYEQKIASIPPAARRAALWMGAFGEGEAMLAAAGSAEVDPVASGSDELRENWDRGKREFNADFDKLNDFFLQVLTGKLEGEAVERRASEFFGLQGPWYTVGYQMAVMVERRYGRAVLIDWLRDRRLLLVRYNAAALEMNRSAQEPGRFPVWSGEILEATAVPR